MGIWGVKTFENDDALDWVYELVESGDYTFIRETFLTVDQHGGYLEVREAARALAAADVLVSSLENKDSDLPVGIRNWIRDHPLYQADDLPALALKSVNRIRSDSELKELLEETDEKDNWVQTINILESRLLKFIRSK